MSLKATKSGLNSIIKNFAGYRYRNWAESANNISEEEFWKKQKTYFVEMYDYALRHVAFYRNHHYPQLKEIDPTGGKHLLEIVEQVPLLTKETLREKITEFYSDNLSAFTKVHTTSGSSGTPLRLAATLNEKAKWNTIRDSWFKEICGKRRPRILYLSGMMVPASSNDIIFRDWLTGDYHVSIYSLQRENRNKIMEYLTGRQPDIIYGYASALHQLALFLETGISSIKENIIGVVTSEVLYPEWKEAIEKYLCKRVFNFYSSQEGCHAVFEGLEGRLQIHPWVGLVEILNSHNKRAAKDEMGEVYITGFIRKSMPLIRYQVGDMAVSRAYQVLPRPAKQWPLIGEILGRSEDLVKTRDGRSIGYLNFHSTKNLEGILESQFVQKDFDLFEINIVLKPDFKNIVYLEQSIKNELMARLQFEPKIIFNYLNSIPKGPNGKFKAVKVEF